MKPSRKLDRKPIKDLTCQSTPSSILKGHDVVPTIVHESNRDENDNPSFIPIPKERYLQNRNEDDNHSFIPIPNGRHLQKGSTTLPTEKKYVTVLTDKIRQQAAELSSVYSQMEQKDNYLKVCETKIKRLENKVTMDSLRSGKSLEQLQTSLASVEESPINNHVPENYSSDYSKQKTDGSLKKEYSSLQKQHDLLKSEHARLKKEYSSLQKKQLATNLYQQQRTTTKTNLHKQKPTRSSSSSSGSSTTKTSNLSKEEKEEEEEQRQQQQQAVAPNLEKDSIGNKNNSQDNKKTQILLEESLEKNSQLEQSLQKYHIENQKLLHHLKNLTSTIQELQLKDGKVQNNDVYFKVLQQALKLDDLAISKLEDNSAQTFDIQLDQERKKETNQEQGKTHLFECPQTMEQNRKEKLTTCHPWSHCTEQITQLENEKKALIDYVQEMISSLEKAKAEGIHLREENTKLSMKVETLDNKIIEVNHQRECEKEKTQNLQNKKKETEKQLNEKKKELENSQEKIKELIRQSKLQEQQLEEFRQIQEDLLLSARDSSVHQDEYRCELGTKQLQLDQLNQKVKVLQEKYDQNLQLHEETKSKMQNEIHLLLKQMQQEKQKFEHETNRFGSSKKRTMEFQVAQEKIKQQENDLRILEQLRQKCLFIEKQCCQNTNIHHQNIQNKCSSSSSGSSNSSLTSFKMIESSTRQVCNDFLPLLGNMVSCKELKEIFPYLYGTVQRVQSNMFCILKHMDEMEQSWKNERQDLSSSVDIFQETVQVLLLQLNKASHVISFMETEVENLSLTNMELGHQYDALQVAMTHERNSKEENTVRILELSNNYETLVKVESLLRKELDETRKLEDKAISENKVLRECLSSSEKIIEGQRYSQAEVKNREFKDKTQCKSSSFQQKKMYEGNQEDETEPTLLRHDLEVAIQLAEDQNEFASKLKHRIQEVEEECHCIQEQVERYFSLYQEVDDMATFVFHKVVEKITDDPLLVATANQVDTKRNRPFAILEFLMEIIYQCFPLQQHQEHFSSLEKHQEYPSPLEKHQEYHQMDLPTKLERTYLPSTNNKRYNKTLNNMLKKMEINQEKVAHDITQKSNQANHEIQFNPVKPKATMSLEENMMMNKKRTCQQKKILHSFCEKYTQSPKYHGNPATAWSERILS